MARRTSGFRSQDATVRTGGTAAIPAVLRALGADPAKVFAEARVDIARFNDPENTIALAAVGRLLDRCVARTGCQHFGLLVGQQGGLQALGLVGLVVRYSPDVGTALRSLENYMHLHNQGAVAALAVASDTAILSFGIRRPNIEAVEQIGDGTVAASFSMLRTLCGPDWRPIEVRFAHRRPDDIGPFRRLFQAPLHFNAEQNALIFSAEWLAVRLPGADAELQRLLQQQINALELKHGDEFPEQVRSVLRTGLLTGHASAKQVAALFSMHARTLSRRLAAFGTTFKALADEGRFEVARQMLQDTTLDVNQIADSLDYADSSAFTRAFRRWTGTTPTAWRAKRHHAG
jgi:AraC-like DNA-binding protein